MKTFIIPDDFEIEVSHIKSWVRSVNRSDDQQLFVPIRAGMGVLTSREAKEYLRRIDRLFPNLKCIIVTDSLPTKLQARYLCKQCKTIRIRILHPENEETKFWLN